MKDQNREESRRALVKSVVSDIGDSERQDLLLWAQSLIEIRDSSLSAFVKARRAIKVSTRKEVVTGTARLIYEKLKPYMRDAKRHGWDERGVAGRFTIGGIALGATVFAGQGAGIAALGSAIGLPLWFVLGAGGSLLGTFVEELSQSRKTRTDYTVIEADRIDVDQ